MISNYYSEKKQQKTSRFKPFLIAIAYTAIGGLLGDISLSLHRSSSSNLDQIMSTVYLIDSLNLASLADTNQAISHLRTLDISLDDATILHLLSLKKPL